MVRPDHGVMAPERLSDCRRRRMFNVQHRRRCTGRRYVVGMARLRMIEVTMWPSVVSGASSVPERIIFESADLRGKRGNEPFDDLSVQMIGVVVNRDATDCGVTAVVVAEIGV